MDLASLARHHGSPPENAMQTFAVTVPPGVEAGEQFEAMLDGKLCMIIVPHGCGPHSTVHVQRPKSKRAEVVIVGQIFATVFDDPNLLNMLLQHLDATQLTTLACCSAHMRRHCLDDALWHRLLVQDYPVASALQGAFYRYIYRAMHLHKIEVHDALSRCFDPDRSAGRVRYGDKEAPTMAISDLQFMINLRYGDRQATPIPPSCVTYAWDEVGIALAAHTVKDAHFEEQPNAWHPFDVVLPINIDMAAWYELAKQDRPNLAEGLLDDLDEHNWQARATQVFGEPWDQARKWTLSLMLYHMPARKMHFMFDHATFFSNDYEEEDFPDGWCIDFGGYYCGNDTSLSTSSPAQSELISREYRHLDHLLWRPRFLLSLENGKLCATIRLSLWYQVCQYSPGYDDGGGNRSIGYVTDKQLLMRLLTCAKWVPV